MYINNLYNQNTHFSSQKFLVNQFNKKYLAKNCLANVQGKWKNKKKEEMRT
uniref:Uncharacterized protein n=1 Tax=Meloidogyne enterolobii TaxID=390850 RepID=A0A6V7VLY1_MELEN|nr:unnamed protein product [Meloidogyne enterolobii]